MCLENRRLSLSELLEGLGGWGQSVSFYGGWVGRGCYSDVRLPPNGHLGVRPQGQGAWNYHPQRTGFDSRPPQLSQVRINGHLVLVSVSGPHTGV